MSEEAKLLRELAGIARQSELHDLRVGFTPDEAERIAAHIERIERERDEERANAAEWHKVAAERAASIRAKDERIANLEHDLDRLTRGSWSKEIARQSARNAELEKKNATLRTAFDANEKDNVELRELVERLEAENEKLMEALEFYAPERHYTKLADPDDEAPPILLDLGAAARGALRVISEARKP